MNISVRWLTVCFRFEGTLDKFIGDAVMAVWGNIHSHGEQADALHAVQAARAMRDELERLNDSWKERGWPVLKAGIAVHHGNVIVGNVGSAQRMEFTVIGEAVNVTWKLQEHTKRIGYPFVMSETVHRFLDERIKTTSLGQANIPGLKAPARDLHLFGIGGRSTDCGVGEGRFR